MSCTTLVLWANCVTPSDVSVLAGSSPPSSVRALFALLSMAAKPFLGLLHRPTPCLPQQTSWTRPRQGVLQIKRQTFTSLMLLRLFLIFFFFLNRVWLSSYSYNMDCGFVGCIRPQSSAQRIIKRSATESLTYQVTCGKIFGREDTKSWTENDHSNDLIRKQKVLKCCLIEDELKCWRSVDLLKYVCSRPLQSMRCLATWTHLTSPNDFKT